MSHHEEPKKTNEDPAMDDASDDDTEGHGPNFRHAVPEERKTENPLGDDTEGHWGHLNQ